MFNIASASVALALVATTSFASASREADPDQPPADAVLQFQAVASARYVDRDLLQVAAGVCSFATAILDDSHLREAFVLAETRAAAYTPAELASDRWAIYGVEVSQMVSERRFLKIVDQDLFDAFVEQEAAHAAASGMTEPALSLFKDLLWEYAPRLAIMPATDHRDGLMQDRIGAVTRATCLAYDEELDRKGTPKVQKVGRRMIRALAFLGGGAVYGGRSDLAQELGRAMVKHATYGLASLDDSGR